jgi:hypothetical protein
LEITVEDLIREAGPVEVRTTRRSWRAVSVFAAVALVLGGVVLAQASDPATHDKSEVVTNIDDGTAVVDGAGATLGRTLGFGQQAQIDVGALIRSIVCPLLATLANTLPAFVAGIINSLRASFGCISP